MTTPAPMPIGGAEPPEADRADPEAVLGDGGEQRDRATEQHREEVERDRAEQDRLAAHEPQPSTASCRLGRASRSRRRSAAAGPAASTRSTVTDADGERRTDRDEDGGRGERHPRVDDVEEATEHRTEDDAACQVTDWRAVSQGRRVGATVSAGSDRVAGVAKARAVPKPITRRKIGSVDVGSVPAYDRERRPR